ncbi:MAG: sugar phosphate isomerase/epimerase, partial [Pseudomonadota bacterium]
MSPPLLAIQLHSLQSVAGLSAQLDLAVRAGFTAVEIIEPHIENGKAMRANLDVRGLSAPSAHVSLGMLRNRPGEVVAGARTAGARQLVVTAPPFATNEADCQAWRALGRELGGLAARLIDTGLTLCFHNHDNELRKLSDGSVPLDLILNEGFHGGLKW